MERLSSTVLSGRYRLESKLGSGGMSTVYLALDEVLDRPVAVKLLHREISEEADQLERFRREARTAARLSHPNLVGVIDAGEDDGRPYIVFEYIEGRTLKRRIQEEGGLPVDEAVAYAIEIGRGLTAAHARKLVHRDVKPQNVLIDPDGRAKVTDFGIARSLEQKGMTATGRVLGTTDYVSPEQAMGEDVDERSDVYSLGVVLYEMLTGDVPFQAETQVGVAMKHVNEPMPDVQAKRPEVSAAVASVVDRATTKDPRDRYGTVAQMVRDLEQTLEVEAARAGRHQRRGDQRARLGPRLAQAIGHRAVQARDRDGGHRRRPDRCRVDHRRPAHPPGRSSSPTSGGTEVQLARRRRQRVRSAAGRWPGDGHRAARDRFEPDRNRLDDRSTTTRRTSAASRTASGLAIDAGSAVAAKSIVIRSPHQGYDAEIYESAGSPPSSLSDWGQPVATLANGGATETIRLPGKSAKSFLIWITRLPQAKDDPGQFQMEISDVRLTKCSVKRVALSRTARI